MNDSRRPDPRRDACEELAELLQTGAGARAARLLQALGFFEDSGTPPGTGPPAALENPLPISIWRPEERDGELVFTRSEPSPFGDHHAARREIPARKAAGVRRVAFFGESVAAGYLYAPHLTPAGVLERELRSAADGYEVVDLARTNETLASLTATVAASLQLDPDVLVVFAGNNWTLLETPELSPYFPSVRSRQHYALALRQGLGGPVAAARRRLFDLAGRALRAIAGHAGDRPVIWVIPEVNLADWDDRQPVPWLEGDGTGRWYALYDRTLAELTDGRFEEAARTAAEMARLDRGLCPTSELLRGRALLGLGDRDGARRAFEAEVSAGAYATAAFLGSPRASAEVQDYLRRATAEHGFLRVDLPRVFAEHSGSPLPGRRLFLDYCHLTREGIGVAMAAVAGEILRLQTGDTNNDRRRPATPEAPPAADAVALLGAAVHGAHRLAPAGDRGPWIEHWLNRAFDADPGVARVMLALAAARAAPCPEVLTPAQAAALDTPYRLLLQHGWRWDHLDADLLRAVVRVLEKRGLPARDEVHRLLLDHHDVGEQGRDLSRPPYLWDPVERFYPQAMDAEERAFYRAAWPESSFCLITDGRRDVELDLTVRLPAIAGARSPRAGEVRLQLDGREVGSIPAGETWERRSLGLPAGRLTAVLHRLTVCWPPPPAPGELALAGARERLELGVEADVHPVFGEVFSLLARAAGPQRRRGPGAMDK